MFLKEYRKKSDNELIKILNSDSYQLSAKETANEVLKERGKSNEIIDNTLELNELSIYEISEKLITFGVSVETSINKERIVITKNNFGFITSIVSVFIGFILLILYLNIDTIGTSDYPSFEMNTRMQILLGMILCFSGSIAVMRSDKLTILKFDFKKNNLTVVKKRKTKREIHHFKLFGTRIEIEKLDQKKIQLNLKSSKDKIELIEVKDNNVGNKSESLLLIFSNKMNDRIKTVANTAYKK
tara:strand:- start:24 stop:749 length:726 start_codon:yes stop_codon:yes gene_type:complete